MLRQSGECVLSLNVYLCCFAQRQRGQGVRQRSRLVSGMSWVYFSHCPQICLLLCGHEFNSSTTLANIQVVWLFLLHLGYFFHSFAWVHGEPLTKSRTAVYSVYIFLSSTVWQSSKIFEFEIVRDAGDGCSWKYTSAKRAKTLQSPTDFKGKQNYPSHFLGIPFDLFFSFTP